MTTASASKTAAEYITKDPKTIRDQGPWDAIVIGTGMGGMACAAALAKCGAKVLMFEQHYVPGGMTHSFSRKGFTWDVGVHCIGEMGPKQLPGELLKWLSNGEVEMKSMGPIYETFHFPDDFKITYPNSIHDLRKQLEERFPDEKEAISQYFKRVDEACRESKLFFALKAVPESVDRFASSRFFRAHKKYWNLTTAQVLDGITQNETLKAALTGQWGYYGSTPSKSSFAIHALILQHFKTGGYYPVEGSASIARALLKTVGMNGGRVCLRTSIDRVIVQNGKAVGVHTRSGDEFFAPKIISAIGSKNTVNHLVPQDYLSTAWAQEIKSLGHSPSYICLNMGFEGDILAAGATVSNQWFFESWSLEADTWDVNDPNSIAPLIYLSFPSLKDPHHDPGPKMKHTGEAVTFVPWSAFEKWKNTRRGNRDSDYLKFKNEIEARLIQQLKKHVPKLMEKLVYHELSTPLSTQFFAQASQGAIYGLEATPRRFNSYPLRTRTPIKNLFLAGGDVASLGVVGAMVGGVLAAGTIKPRILTRLIG